MAKSKSKQGLLDQISGLEPAERAYPRSWAEIMKVEDPERYAEIRAVIDDFNAGGIVRTKFPSIVALHRYLAGEDPDRPREPVFKVGMQAFRAHVLKLRSKNNG